MGIEDAPVPDFRVIFYDAVRSDFTVSTDFRLGTNHRGVVNFHLISLSVTTLFQTISLPAEGTGKSAKRIFWKRIRRKTSEPALAVAEATGHSAKFGG
jgi:hypothetical protein